jgi:phosphoglycolate phosphatase-like HAD superfamily hydrolase
MVIFDFDGVLVESVDVKTRAFAKMFEAEGPDIVEKVVDYHINNGGISRYEKFRYFYDHFLRRPMSEDRLDELGRQFSDLVVSEVVAAPWVKGAKEFLDRYHSSLEMYVATGTPHEEIIEVVRRRRMGHYFNEVIGTPPAKEEIICRIVESVNFAADEIVMVGDAPQDLAGALAAGISFVGRIDSPDSPLCNDESITKLPDLQGLSDVLGL